MFLTASPDPYLNNRHRYPVSHKCTVATPAAGPSIVTKNEKARALLAKMSSSTGKSSLKQTTKLPTNPAKLATHHRVEVMKMRHKAMPLDAKDKVTPVPLDQRLHIKVQHDDKVNVFWVRKVCRMRAQQLQGLRRFRRLLLVEPSIFCVISLASRTMILRCVCRFKTSIEC